MLSCYSCCRSCDLTASQFLPDDWIDFLFCCESGAGLRFECQARERTRRVRRKTQARRFMQRTPPDQCSSAAPSSASTGGCVPLTLCLRIAMRGPNFVGACRRTPLGNSTPLFRRKHTHRHHFPHTLPETMTSLNHDIMTATPAFKF